jgi:hypothetical protein
MPESSVDCVCTTPELCAPPCPYCDCAHCTAAFRQTDTEA